MKYHNTLQWIFQASGFLVLIASFVAVLNPDVRSAVREKLAPEFRVVLSTAQGDVMGNHLPIKAVKVNSHEGIYVEVYGAPENGHQPLLAKLPLHHTRDAYFVFNNQPTNLAIDDVDGDGKLEILAPSFDEDLMAHLTVFKYNTDSQSFERVSNQN